jgi:hypothetical protein
VSFPDNSKKLTEIVLAFLRLYPRDRKTTEKPRTVRSEVWMLLILAARIRPEISDCQIYAPEISTQVYQQFLETLKNPKSYTDERECWQDYENQMSDPQICQLLVDMLPVTQVNYTGKTMAQKMNRIVDGLEVSFRSLTNPPVKLIPFPLKQTLVTVKKSAEFKKIKF